MNLRVDLIDRSEQRSASPVSLKALVRIMAFAIPALAAVLLFALVLNAIRVKQELAALERLWADTKPQKETATKFREEYYANKDILNELQGWQASRAVWHAQLYGLMRVVPPNIQLRTLKAGQTLQRPDDAHPARVFSMSLSGKAIGGTAEQSVQLLRRHLSSDEAFAEVTESVDVAKYGADTAKDALKTDREFVIDVAYRPMTFE